MTATTMMQETLSLFQKNKKYLKNLVELLDRSIWKDIKTIFLILMLSMIILQISFFPSTIIKCNNWDLHMKMFPLFKERILILKLLPANSIFHCLNPKSLKLIARLWLRLSHFRCHEFKDRLQDTLNFICVGGIVETTVYYLLHFPIFHFKV